MGRRVTRRLCRVEIIVLAALCLGGTWLTVAEAASSLPPRAAARMHAQLEVTRRIFAAANSRCERFNRGQLVYHWPVRPFLRQHPIRGYFGDPRTVGRELLGTDRPGSAGSFTFHNGVDVYAPNGTAVYPVVSGLAHIKSSDAVSVTTGDGRVFQYFHILPAVTAGEPVVAYHTVLGYVKRPWRHVHLTEIDNFRTHNPLDPRALHGTITIVAEAADTPAMSVPGHWLGFPVTPAFVGWRLVSATGAVVYRRTAADFRFREPAQRDFWSVYAAGTYQNFPDFTGHFYWRVRGRYLFNLTPRALDTRRLRNGTYGITVVAADTCGNRSTLSEQIAVDNAPPAPQVTARAAGISS